MAPSSEHIGMQRPPTSACGWSLAHGPLCSRQLSFDAVSTGDESRFHLDCGLYGEMLGAMLCAPCGHERRRIPSKASAWPEAQERHALLHATQHMQRLLMLLHSRFD